MDSDHEKQLVVKSNYLIEASYQLSVQEQRIILMMVSQIHQGDEDFKKYRIRIQDLVELAGIEGHSKYEEIKAVTEKLLGRTLKIKKEKSFLQIGWLSSAEYFDSQGYVELCFDPKLKPFLLRLKSFFTRYQLENAMKLKSSYSIRAYELLTQYRKIGHRTFKLSDLRDTLGLKPHKYKLYADFKRKILKTAQKELSQKTDITFDCQEIKEGRKVVALKFVLSSNEKPLTNQELFDRLVNYFCLTRKQASQVIENFPEFQVNENLKYVEAQLELDKVRNIGSYTLEIIRRDCRLQTSMFAKEKEQEKQKKEKMMQAEIEQQRKKEEQVKELLKNMSDKEKEALHERAFNELAPELRDREKFIEIMMFGILSREME